MEPLARKKPRPRRSFTAEFKADIVECGGRGDRTVGQLAKDFDLTETAVREWVKQAERDEGSRVDGGLTSSEREELAQLRRDNRRMAVITHHPPTESHSLLDKVSHIGSVWCMTPHSRSPRSEINRRRLTRPLFRTPRQKQERSTRPAAPPVSGSDVAWVGKVVLFTVGLSPSLGSPETGRSREGLRWIRCVARSRRFECEACRRVVAVQSA
ncbi:transposase [Pseudonocardia spinosispora]|uniref:transposase n=1 Tax=Pseudonocardia spinosispora TaxID=103441 RepID=UPI00146F9E38